MQFYSFDRHAFYFNYFGGTQENRIYWWLWVRRLAPRLLWAKDPPSVQGNMIRDVFGPTAIQWWLFCHHIFKFICFKLSKYPRLGDVGFLEARPPYWGPQSHALCSAAWTLWLGQCGPWPLCPGAFQKHHTYLSGARLGAACQSWMSTAKGCLQGPLGQPIQATGWIHCQGGCCL